MTVRWKMRVNTTWQPGWAEVGPSKRGDGCMVIVRACTENNGQGAARLTIGQAKAFRNAMSRAITAATKNARALEAAAKKAQRGPSREPSLPKPPPLPPRR